MTYLGNLRSAPQASFEPPGLTVSVKKDRAMEPLLQIGNKFAISTVAEGKEKVVMRRCVQRRCPVCSPPACMQCGCAALLVRLSVYTHVHSNL